MRLQINVLTLSIRKREYGVKTTLCNTGENINWTSKHELMQYCLCTAEN